MLDIGFPELLLVALVILLVFGPERLPEVLRTLGGWVGQARRSFTSFKQEIEREVGADELRRDLHNARVLEEARKLREEFEQAGDGLRRSEKEIDAEVRRALTGATDDDQPASDSAGGKEKRSGDPGPAK